MATMITDDINGSIGVTQQSIVIPLGKQTNNFAWVCIAIMIIVICLLMEKKSISLKLMIKMSTFQLNFV